MRLKMLYATVFWVCVFLLAVWMLRTAQSPPAAYAAVVLAAAAIGALGLSLLIIRLTGH